MIDVDGEKIKLRVHPREKEIISDHFSDCYYGGGEYAMWDVLDVAKDYFDLRVMELVGMESYPRCHLAHIEGDALIVVYGGQVDVAVRDAVGGRYNKETHAPKSSDCSGRMFKPTERRLDNEGLTYIGGRIVECPISGNVKFRRGKLEGLVYRYSGLIKVYRVRRSDIENIMQGATKSMRIYKKLSTAKSRMDAARQRVNDSSWSRKAVRFPLQYVYMKQVNDDTVRSIKSLFFDIGLPLHRSRKKVCKRALSKCVGRRIRKKKLSKREQEFFSMILATGKLSRATH